MHILISEFETHTTVTWGLNKDHAMTDPWAYAAPSCAKLPTEDTMERIAAAAREAHTLLSINPTPRTASLINWLNRWHAGAVDMRLTILQFGTIKRENLTFPDAIAWAVGATARRAEN